MLLQTKQIAKPKTVSIITQVRANFRYEYDLYIEAHSIINFHFDNKNLDGNDESIQREINISYKSDIESLSSLIRTMAKSTKFNSRGIIIGISCSSGKRCSVGIANLLRLYTKDISIEILNLGVKDE
jgi:RNase adaptor protein for sRNA GlmZ degradation